MKTNNYILQKLKTSVDTDFKRAEMYYTILSLVNNLELTKREIQLVTFAAIRGNISSSTNKNDFCSLFNSSYNTIKNIVSKLRKMGIFIKQNNKTIVNPIIVLDFKKNLSLFISIENDDRKAKVADD